MASKSLPLSGCVLYSSKFTHDIPQSCSARPLKYKTWTSENLERACQAVESGLSLRQAAEEYQIPKSTIQDHVSGKVLSGSKSGQKYLTDEEEEELVTFLLETAKIGFPRTRKEVISIVQATVDRKGRNVTVSSGWWEGFRKRHSELSLRITEQIANNRASACTPDVLSNYFDILEQTIQENDLVSKPTQLFNCDETGMPLDPKPPKGVTAKGVKHPRAITTGNKTQITVLASCNAAGYCMPPFVIFDRKCLKQAMVDGEVPGTMYGLSESGWINSELFDLWFVHHFLPYAPTVRPILLLLDGHSSHYNPSVINKAAEEKVIIFCLPPHSSHETQPLDKGPFGPLKSSWRQVCRKFLVDNPGKVVTRFTFSKLFSEAWACAMTMKNIQAGFKYTGIYPLNRDAIVPSRKDATSTLAQRTGLKFIPLYSPARRYRPPITQEAVFTEEEESRFQKRFQEGYDITSDDRYNQWKKKHQSSNDGSGFVDQELDLSSQFSHNDTVANDANTRMFYQYPHYPPDTRYPYYPQDTLPYFPFFVPAFDPRFQSCPSTASAESNTYTFVCHPPEQPLQSAVLQKSSIFSKILEEERSLPFCKLPVIPQKKSGKVLTSAENRMAIEEKEKRKLEEMRRKEEKKEKRNQARIAQLKKKVLALKSPVLVQPLLAVLNLHQTIPLKVAHCLQCLKN